MSVHGSGGHPPSLNSPLQWTDDSRTDDIRPHTRPVRGVVPSRDRWSRAPVESRSTSRADLSSVGTHRGSLTPLPLSLLPGTCLLGRTHPDALRGSVSRVVHVSRLHLWTTPPPAHDLLSPCGSPVSRLGRPPLSDSRRPVWVSRFPTRRTSTSHRPWDPPRRVDTPSDPTTVVVRGEEGWSDLLVTCFIRLPY